MKNYLVTGVSSGLGAALSKSLLNQGHHVLGISRNIEKIEKLSIQFQHRLTTLSIDLSLPFDNLVPIEEFVKTYGKLHGMICCAGREETVPLSLYIPEKVHDLFSVNFNSIFELTRFFAKKKISEEGASIIYISSVMSELGQPGKTAYCASKSALIGLARASALELANRKIRVNAVSPGVVETPMTEKLFAQIGDEGKKRVLEMHPLGFGQTDDIIPLIEFLLSDNSRWITGQNIRIDGGYSVH